MAFALLSRSRSKPQGSVKPVPKQKSALGQRPVDSRFGFAKPVFQPQTAALPTVPVIQTKLKVGEPDDKFEEEADRVADEVMRMPNNTVSGVASPGFKAHDSAPARGAPPSIQRMCSECTEEDQKLQRMPLLNAPAPPRIQRFAGQRTGQMDAVPASVDQALASPGRPLESALRQDMEQRFGYDFSRVRVHSSAAAEQSAQDVNANAYTMGRDIVFGAGRLVPGTHEGRRLIAHELTHVVQQSGAEGVRVGQGNEKRGLFPVARSPSELIVARQTTGARTPVPAPSATVFHPGVMHNHAPSGRWADVQAAPNSGSTVSFFCKHSDPADVIRVASFAELRGKLIAQDHLKWFFKGGGANFVEDSNLDLMLRTDSGVQWVLGAKIPTGRSSGIFADHVEITQNDYDDEEFQYSFGAIDRLDFEIDFAAGTLHAWFQDRYEWHPVYPFYTKLPGDIVRETNCVHAAAVELKSGTARDYWMKGEATIPLKALRSAAYRWQHPKPVY